MKKNTMGSVFQRLSKSKRNESKFISRRLAGQTGLGPKDDEVKIRSIRDIIAAVAYW